MNDAGGDHELEDDRKDGHGHASIYGEGAHHDWRLESVAVSRLRARRKIQGRPPLSRSFWPPVSLPLVAQGFDDSPFERYKGPAPGLGLSPAHHYDASQSAGGTI